MSNNTIWVGELSDKVFIQSGQFTSTLLDSFDTTTLPTSEAEPTSAAERLDNNTGFIIGRDNGAVMITSGIFSSTLKDSQDISALTPFPRGVFPSGANTVFSGYKLGVDYLYLLSGQVTGTVKDSHSDTMTFNIEDCSERDDGSVDTLYLNNSSLYLLSGQFTATIKDSEYIDSVDNLSHGIAYNGVDTGWTGQEHGKLYLQSGVITSTVKTSEDISAIEVGPAGMYMQVKDTTNVRFSRTARRSPYSVQNAHPEASEW